MFTASGLAQVPPTPADTSALWCPRASGLRKYQPKSFGQMPQKSLPVEQVGIQVQEILVGHEARHNERTT